jgi:hypothetical protein
MSEIEVGTLVETNHGPYRAVAEVIEVTERGAVLAYPFNAVLVGHDECISAPDGTQLTQDKAHGFLGRAHFADAKVVVT